MTLFSFTRLVVVGAIIAFSAPSQFAFAQSGTPSTTKTTPKPQKNFFIPVDQKNPESVITAYFKLSAMNRIQEASTLLGPVYNIETISKITQEMRVFSELVRTQKMEVNLLEVKKQGDWALAILVAKYQDGNNATHKSLSDQYMIRLQNQWRVVPVALRQDPAFTDFLDSDAIAMFEFWSKNKTAYEKKYLGK